LKPTACPWLAAAAQSSTQSGAFLVRVSAVLRRASAQTRTPMSRRRCKHVLQSVLQDDAEPPMAGQSIVRAVGSRGGNHVEARPCLLALQCVAQDWQPHLRPLAYAASARSVALKRATQLRAEPPARLPACLDQQGLTQERGFPCRRASTGAAPQVEFPGGRRTLAMLPARFNKKLWVRRGGYLVVEEAPGDGAAAVSAMIVRVLYADGARALRKLPGVWCAAARGGRLRLLTVGWQCNSGTADAWPWPHR